MIPKKTMLEELGESQPRVLRHFIESVYLAIPDIKCMYRTRLVRTSFILIQDLVICCFGEHLINLSGFKICSNCLYWIQKLV